MAIKPNHIPKKRLFEIWSQVPPDYYDRGIKKNILQKLWHTRKLTEILKLVPQNAKKVLDVGCSSGILTAAVAESLPKSEVVGLDSYKRAIEFASKKYPHLKFIVGDAHKLPFGDKSFDLVICTETLEHLVDPKQALAQMKRVLTTNGKTIISMDSGNILFRTIWFFWTRSKGRVWEGAHLHEFNAKILEKLIKKSGFRIKEKKTSHLGMAVTFLAIPR